MYRYNGLAVILFSMVYNRSGEAYKDLSFKGCLTLAAQILIKKSNYFTLKKNINIDIWAILAGKCVAQNSISLQDSSTHRNTSMTAKIHRKESQRYRLVRLSDILKINDSVIGVNELLYFD
ncbi:hypothetical protein PHYBLDRAFT_70171 [Phycomyces blakesleeanus NRRL 1555(-)]|uniref:Uncharacterized protein n=1 Tax=Phycomyces blakesleeanus (strain ATCC 8743b / DSM 1359 / FGSC 10004 / NBRC 33097 / NRRL 1555) TaxID=763407 RepID=A0A167JWX4_PHYB8|nr:hypothetical protein PHYBLDRAFT_70171 [Phycomyces blakesleeanus NRRL 1555(-)]OAD66838.1 hypothetical protein PHYBLDRAFT_70171 [Phycomyces blakesleeanus NRRL 1555(-)]|eukprot:XP_018284878.1 hypothetical protein PHYBLDRAFT_70171 [Phycomyces blakesleeanus NRRL 1555(-)]